MTIWQPAYVGLGSNLDDPRAQVRAAQRRLAELPVTSTALHSRLYGTRPMGPVAQPDFVNAVTGLLTQLDPRQLLEALRALESEFGRPAVHERWGPRVLDLDLLVYGRERRGEPDLTLPHPGIVERNFVLYPLADIAPDLDVPGLGRVAELKGRVSGDGIWTV
jgi:2-amino-4-hydroxy-6-hydroxymethyldihydropteridine diphosphokinase